MAKLAAEQQSSRKRQNRFLAMLIIGAALVSGAKDLGQFQELSGGLFGLVSSLRQTVGGSTPAAEPGCPQTLAENDNSVQPFYWNGRVAPDQLIEIGGVDVGQPVGDELAVVAVEQARPSEPASESTQVALRTKVVTECAAPASGDSRQVRSALLLSHRLRNQSATMVRRNLRLDFMVQVPAAVAFIGRAINEETKAAGLSGRESSFRVVPIVIQRVASNPQTGGINVLAIGDMHARIQLRTSCREIKMKLRDVNRSEAIGFKSKDGRDTLDLIQLLKAKIYAERLSADSLSDLPLSLPEIIHRASAAQAAEGEESH